MSPEDKAFVVRASRDPLVREALELLAPINPDAARALRVAKAIERVTQSGREEIHLVGPLREALSQPGALDDLRAHADDPIARDLLRVAERLGIQRAPEDCP
jgi:hypothetical protein